LQLISPSLQQFSVNLRGGQQFRRSGRIGTGVAAKSDADGHTLVMTRIIPVIAPQMGVP